MSERAGWPAVGCAVATGVFVVLGAATGPAYAAAEPAATCAASQLSGTIGFRGAAAGNRYARLVLTNQGAACTLQGLPGLQLVGADGRLLGTRVDAWPPEEVPPLVHLAPQASAGSDLHWIVGPCFTQGDDGTADARPTSITVVPPGEAASITLPWELGYVCGEPDGPAEIDASSFAAI